jgi:prepilin-type N-terminal cleavage/methylation domain-containing protein
MRPVPSRHGRAALGFTLVELLVVIGIIAVLISLLVPALARTRQQAVSLQCLSNLRQQGLAAVLYANENRGQLPSATRNAIETIPSPTREALSRLLRGATRVYYCPVNTIRAWTPDDFLEGRGGNGLPDSSRAGKILYWWLGNPVLTYLPDGRVDEGAIPWLDLNGNGTKLDEIVFRLGQKNAATTVISTDQSRQQQAGWFFIHGRTGFLPATTGMPPAQLEALAANVKGCWKNNLYGDGHAESVRPDQVKARWSSNAAAW